MISYDNGLVQYKIMSSVVNIYLGGGQRNWPSSKEFTFLTFIRNISYFKHNILYVFKNF